MFGKMKRMFAGSAGEGADNAGGGVAGSAASASTTTATTSLSATGSSAAKADSSTTQASNAPTAPAKKREWKAVLDQRTGRTYYYDTVTLETRWDKPLDDNEAQVRSLRWKRPHSSSIPYPNHFSQKQAAFFEEMEKNIQQKMRKTGYSCDMTDMAESLQEELSGKSASKKLDANASSKFPSLPDPKLPGHGAQNFHRVRTISSVDGAIPFHALFCRLLNAYPPSLLDSMLQDSDFAFYSMGRESFGGGAFSPGSGGIGFGSMRTNSSENKDMATSPSSPRVSRQSITEKHIQRGVSEMGNPAHRRASLSRDDSCIDPRRKTVFAVADVDRRPRCNSTSTIFVATTMCAPDKDATITCVCTVIRAHLKEAQARLLPKTSAANRNFQKFEENVSILPNPAGTMPTLKTLSTFMRTIFLRAQIEDECVIMSLIYLERLLKVSGLILSATTWRSIMLSSMIMASKVWDDLRCVSNTPPDGGGVCV
jgi:hypothetical protein